MRKPANDRPDDGDAAPSEIPGCARSYCARDRDQWAGTLGANRWKTKTPATTISEIATLGS